MNTSMLARTTTGSRPYSYARNRLLDGPTCLATHGVNVAELNFLNLKGKTAWGNLFGNCMSVPCVGAIFTVLCKLESRKPEIKTLEKWNRYNNSVSGAAVKQESI